LFFSLSKSFLKIFDSDFKTAQFSKPYKTATVAVAAITLAMLVDLHKSAVIWSYDDALAATLFFFEKLNHKRGQIRLSAKVALRLMENTRFFILQIAEVAEKDSLRELFEYRNFIIL
jgi:hypothetical protein